MLSAPDSAPGALGQSESHNKSNHLCRSQVNHNGPRRRKRHALLKAALFSNKPSISVRPRWRSLERLAVETQPTSANWSANRSWVPSFYATCGSCFFRFVQRSQLVRFPDTAVGLHAADQSVDVFTAIRCTARTTVSATVGISWKLLVQTLDEVAVAVSCGFS